MKEKNRMFECSKQISVKSVTDAIDLILKKNLVDDFYTHEYPNEKMHLTEHFDASKSWKDQPIKSVLTYEEIFNSKDYEHGGAIITPGDIVLDVGAHIGVFTRYALYRGAKRVIAFEPGNDNYLLFLKNIPEGANVKCYPMAVSDRIGMSDLYLDSHHIHSILPEPGNPTKTGKLSATDTITLDEIINTEPLQKIDFLKMDIEGSEVLALKGISDENLKKVIKASIEYHHKAFNYDESIKESIIQRFSNLGFKFFIHIFLNSNDAFMLHFWQ